MLVYLLISASAAKSIYKVNADLNYSETITDTRHFSILGNTQQGYVKQVAHILLREVQLNFRSLILAYDEAKADCGSMLQTPIYLFMTRLTVDSTGSINT